MASGLYAGQTLPDTGLPMLLLDGAGLAARNGIQFSRDRLAADPDEAAIESEGGGFTALLFRDLDGERRAAPLAVIDRVEDVSPSDIRLSAGRLRISINDCLVPLVARGDTDGFDAVSVLRLHDGETEIGYVIAEALDIIKVPDTMVPASRPGPVAGVVPMDGEQIELIDVHWIFAEEADRLIVDPAEEPLCLFAGSDTAWMESFLRPVVEAAGYRVVTRLEGGEKPVIALAMGDVVEVPSADIPIVKLSKRKDKQVAEGDAIYRYDRDRIAQVLAERRASTGGR